MVNLSILFSPLALKDIFATLGHDLPTSKSVNDSVIDSQGFGFRKISQL